MGNEELETIIELIASMLFMGVCIVLTGAMCVMMASHASHYHKTDKVEVNADASAEEDPFYFTGYEAYMFAWMMDPYSDEPLSWFANDGQKASEPNDLSITVSVLDENRNSRINFLAYRNHLIAGSGLVNSIRAVLRAVEGETHTNEFYAGKVNPTTATTTYMHLTLDGDVGKYVDERRDYSWVLVPVRVSP